MAFVEDFAAYFADFGTPATVGGVSVVGIFDRQAAEAFGMVSGNSPQIIVTDTVAAAENTTVTVAGAQYVVTEVRDDGTGLRALHLEALA